MDVLEWLLDNADPAIRFQVLRDLTDARATEVAAVREQVAVKGWGARLLDARDVKGIWAGGACFPASFDGDLSRGQPWTSTLPSLTLLREFGVLPDMVADVIDAVAHECRWEHAGQRFFDGEVEPCINGRVLALGAYFGVDVTPVARRLLSEQLPDGGWNCAAENGSIRSSTHTTINVLEGLLEYERAQGPVDVTAARHRGEQYLLRRKLLRRLRDGTLIDPAYLEFSFPTWWHYDVLRALEYFRSTGHPPRPDMDEALRVVTEAALPDGRWPLRGTHAGEVRFVLESGDGRPSRWTTLRALRVLRWAEIA